MEQTRSNSTSVYRGSQEKAAMFPREGGTSCDHRVAAAALVTLAALTSFFFLPSAVGLGLSLISAGLIVWILNDRCSSSDWSECGNTTINFRSLFVRTNNSPSVPRTREERRRVPRETPLSSSRRPPTSEALRNRHVTKAPETDKGPRVPTPNASPALKPALGSQQFKSPEAGSQMGRPTTLGSQMSLQSQGARVGLNSPSTPLSSSTSSTAEALRNRPVTTAPEMDKGPRVSTPNASPALKPAPGSQQFKPPEVSSQMGRPTALGSQMSLQSQGARVGLNSPSTPWSSSTSATSEALRNRPVTTAPEMDKGPRVPTPNASPSLAPPVGSKLFKPLEPNLQPRNQAPLSSQMTLQSQRVRVSIEG